MAKRFSVEAVFKGIDKISAPISRMQSRIGKFTRNAGRKVDGLRRKFKGLGNGIKKFALASTAAFAIMGVAAADVIKTGADFEQSIVNATAKVGGLDQTSERFIKTQQALTKEARRLGATTQFTATQAAEGLNTLITAGFDANQAVASLSGVLDLATIAQVDMAEAADIATGALGSFNLKAKDSAQLAKNMGMVTDVLARTTNTSKNTMVDLAEALKDGGPAAKAVGADIQTFAAIAGKMADGNIRGTKAGTAMRSMFLRLANPPAKAAKELTKLDIVIRKSNGDMRDIVDILGDLERKTRQMGTGQRPATMENIFGKVAISGVVATMTQGVDKLRDYREQLKKVNGESTKMAGITRNTVGGSLKALASAIESVKITIFEANKGPLKKMIDDLTRWIRTNEKLIAEGVGDAVKAFVNNKDELITIAKAFSTMAQAILDGVKAMKTLHGLIKDTTSDRGAGFDMFGRPLTKKQMQERVSMGRDLETDAQVQRNRTMMAEAQLRQQRKAEAQAIFSALPASERTAEKAKEIMIKVGLDDGLQSTSQKSSPGVNLTVESTGGM